MVGMLAPYHLSSEGVKYFVNNDRVLCALEDLGIRNWRYPEAGGAIGVAPANCRADLALGHFGQ